MTSASSARAAVCLLIAAALGAAGCARETELERGLAALREAFREERPVEARITGFDYAPAARQRGQRRFDGVRRNLASGLISYAAASRPDAESHHALGRYYLAVGRLDEAVKHLKAALALDPRCAPAHSDLGAALMEKGRDAAGAGEFAEGLDHLNRALALDDALDAALFNRALLHAELGLASAAEADWRAYLARDGDSGWAAEARRGLARLAEGRQKTSRGPEAILRDFVEASRAGDDEAAWKLFRSYHNRAGNVVSEQLLDAFLARAAAGGEEGARESLDLLTYAGRLAELRAGERFFSELARLYAAAAPARLGALSEARALWKAGHEGWGRLPVPENLKLFERAGHLFRAAGHAGEAAAADYWVAFCHYHGHGQAQSRAIVEPLITRSEARGHLWLRARGLYLLSAVEFKLNEHSKAVALARRAYELAGRDGDTVGMLNAATSLIEYYRFLGNYPQSLVYVRLSLPLTGETALDPVQGARHYGFVATSFAALGRYAAAAAYQHEAMRYAADTGRENVVAQQHAFLGMLRGKLGDFEAALGHVRLAFEIAGARPGEPAASSLAAYVSLQTGHIQREAGRLDEAVASYTRAIERYEAIQDFPLHLYHAHKGRLLCYLAQGDDQRAGEEIATTLALVERYRAEIHEENNRNTFFDAEQSVYDAAIDFAHTRLGDARRAFEYLDSSRARSLHDLLEFDREALVRVRDQEIVLRSVAQPLGLAEIQRRMPERAQILQYAVLENRTLAWVITREKLSSVAVEVGQGELAEKVSAYVRLVSGPPGEEGEAERLGRAGELYELLVRPVEPLLDKERVVCVVADKALHQLPFAALVSPATGRHLVEDYLTVTSQSPTVFVLASERAARMGGAERERLLGVGNPSFDRAAFRMLPDLPSAAREAEAVAALYGAAPLLGGDASRAAVMREIAGADVVHLALHSALDAEVPLRSKLLLASTPGGARPEESALHAYDIYNLKLPRARLVVLSACQTGAERYYGGEGLSSLARPFLAAGAPLVVASLWPVDSDATAELMVNLHRRRKREGLPTAAALRAAQLDMLRGPDTRLRHPYYWAPFAVTGGHATF